MKAGVLVELRKFHCTNRLVHGVNTIVKEGDVVTVYDEKPAQRTLKVR